MNLIISGHHLDVTPALHDYVVAKLARVMRHFDQAVDAAVILAINSHSEKKTRQQAEIILRLKGKIIFVASASSSLYEAVDVLVDKLDRQILRYKERAVSAYHGGASAAWAYPDVDDARNELAR